MNTKRLLKILILSVALFALVAGCSSDDDPVTPPAPTLVEVQGTVGATGGTLTSSDGSMSLTVPAGVLTADTEISIVEADPTTADAILDEYVVRKTFTVTPPDMDLGPESIWAFTWDVPASATKGGGAHIQDIPVAITRVTADDITTLRVEDQLANLQLVPSGQTSTATVSLRGLSGSHVSIVSVRGSGGTGENVWTGGLQNVPASVLKDIPFLVDSQTVHSLDVVRNSDLSYGRDALAGVVSTLTTGETLTITDTGTYEDLSTYAECSLPFTGSAAGTGTGTYEIDSVYALKEGFWDDYKFAPEFVGTLGLSVRYESISVTIEEDTTPGGDVDEGVWAISLIGLEAFARPLPAMWEHSSSVLGTGSNGVGFFNPYSSPPFQAVNTDLVVEGNTKYGAFPITVGYQFKKAPGDDNVAIMGFGPNSGSLSQWIPEDSMFGWSQLFALGKNVTDGYPLEGDPFTEAFIYTVFSNSTVLITAYDSGQEAFVSEGPYGGFLESNGNAVSSFARVDGSLVAVTDGAPGHLYVHDRSSTGAAATQIGAVGDGPRRVRVLGEIGVVSNFSGGSLTIFTWDQADNLAITATIPVGDGPIGIDLVARPGGEVAIVSTGFNDDSWSMTVVDATGALVSNIKHDLPGGAEAPGHAIFLAENGNQVLISCNATNNVVVAGSGL